jgi:glutamine synthetase
MMNLETLTRLLEAAGVRRVRFEIADTHGIARSKTVPLMKLPDYGARGVGFYGAMLKQDAAGDDVPQPGVLPPPDFLMMPDLDTLAILPYAPGDARVICNLHSVDGRSALDDSRYVARQMLCRFADRGITVRTGFELEFYLIDRDSGETAFPDRQICSTVRNNADPELRDAILDALPAFGLQVSTYSVENAPGQYEITFSPIDGIDAADATFSFRTAVKEIARKYGFNAPFMTKPFITEAASGTHIHQSLIDSKTGRNLMMKAAGTNELSELGRHFLAGQLHHADALSAFLSPTPNDYKRYQPGSFAPVNKSWGVDNRSASIRVPATAIGNAARIENRIGGAAASPYIALAATLAAGLDGIERKLEPPEPIVVDAAECGDIPPLPRSLEDALDALDRDEPLREMLGDTFIRTYCLVKRFDVQKAREACADYGTDDWYNRIDRYEWHEYGELI